MNWKRNIRIIAFGYLLGLVTSSACSSEDGNNEETGDSTAKIDLSKLNLPEGYSISIYSPDVKNARSMAVGTRGTLFIGTREEGKVYALRDTDGDFKADEKFVIASGMRAPNGVAFKDGALYVANVNELWRYDDIEDNLANPPKPELIYKDYPKDYHHGWKYIAFGPDGKLYIPVGAPCNNCESRNEMYASITRINPDGSGREVFASGVRNTVGFTWHPESGEMWFTDNGRDMLGDDIPPCELNRASEAGQHFGYPYCHGGTIKDPEFGSKFPCSDFVEPEINLGAHVAPLGIKFNTGGMFSANMANQVFIAEHGSWNRSKKIGYRISLVRTKDGRASSYETFIDGWLDEGSQKAWGRPVDVLFVKDGSMLISDDMVGAIYRVTYSD